MGRIFPICNDSDLQKHQIIASLFSIMNGKFTAWVVSMVFSLYMYIRYAIECLFWINAWLRGVVFQWMTRPSIMTIQYINKNMKIKYCIFSHHLGKTPTDRLINFNVDKQTSYVINEFKYCIVGRGTNL